LESCTAPLDGATADMLPIAKMEYNAHSHEALAVVPLVS
jgi:hypothetical protein